ncbi:MAG: hypothetical protein JOY62_04325 [Acidobacteriaceae bacterium]|nr:hypothetical protein [Acidobacteriaceae bacterium]MBV9779180.1 hypothetical protein [Acidobacteriaceae bacterium]
MTNQQLYFAIGVPVFAVIVGIAMNMLALIWQSRDVSKRLDRIEHTLELIQTDLKEFYRDIVRIKQKIGLD